ncbi:uracil-DNA glycosylase [Oceanibium sediminis]|uniref:uracil-DNA glycosylase n=1 Tax=Oceanibium sediminis TaxID=2026339 RepID=UPI000DD383DA|nr:uracil-DNA glycosylase [Oceanibium sediminis]
MSRAEPPKGCRRCPRLVAHRRTLARAHPDWWGGAVPSFGAADARILILGLAPGRMGAHRTGRAFTGDDSGRTLFEALTRNGLASGTYDSDGRDDIALQNTMITNALRCLPPDNRPTGEELSACRPFLAARIAALPRLRAVLCVGRVAHEALLRCLDVPQTAAPFEHGAEHRLNGLQVFDSYHCSRYNMNTRRLTPSMLDAVLGRVRDAIMRDGNAPE